MPADRLFARLPAHIRARDAAEGHPLRALLGVLEAELDLLAEDARLLHENAFIETCEAWAVPYLGGLVGALPLDPAAGEGFSLRAFVANTLEYRRAKGTAAVLARLARDVTGWPARVVEYWRLLAQTQPVNHVRDDPPGTASIRDTDRAAQAGTAFEPHAHTAELRPIAPRGEGRFAVPNIGVHLWRLLAAPIGFAFAGPSGVLGGVMPRPTPEADGRFHLHPAGLDAPLFNRPRRAETGPDPTPEQAVPAPLRRLPLRRELAARRAGRAPDTGWFDSPPVVQVRLGGTTLPPERLHIAHLGARADGSWRRPRNRGEAMLDPELGRLALHPDDAALPVEVALAVGAAAELGAGPWDRREDLARWLPEAIDDREAEPWIAAVSRRTEEHTANPANGGPCLASLADAIAAWNAGGNAPDARGLIAILDSATYGEPLPPLALARGARLAIIAAAWPPTEEASGARRRRLAALLPVGRRPFIAGTVRLGIAGAGARLVLDGLMVEGGARVEAGGPVGLDIRACTLGAGPAGLGDGLVVAAEVEAAEIALARSICGRLRIGPAGRIALADSVIGEDREAEGGSLVLTASPAIEAPLVDAGLARCTVFGAVRVRTLDASEVIATGSVTAARRQQGCVRYSHLPFGSRTAPRFRCQPDLALAAAAARLRAADPTATLPQAEAEAIARSLLPRFTATRFEQPGFAQLHPLCPDGVAAGGEGGREMGALAGLGGPRRRANLEAAIADMLRVGLEVGLFPVT